LSDEVRAALIALFDMRWVDVEDELSEDDAEEYRRLLRPESPDFILNLEDYYAFFTYTLFSGRVIG
jgi:demethylmenaquinone methyltransferase/2-methoxy-6-polyprenyl-1,4-benzoquinol methylase